MNNTELKREAAEIRKQLKTKSISPYTIKKLKARYNQISDLLCGFSENKTGDEITFKIHPFQIVVGKFISKNKDLLKVEIISDSYKFFQIGSVANLHTKYIQ